VIGRGGFGKVWKVLLKKTQKLYALKEMSKVKIIDRKSEKSIKNERNFLSFLHHPFIVNMIFAFQDYENLYLVMDLLTGGDLRYHLCKNKKFNEKQTKFFFGCLLLGLEYIHKNNIIHRDIKPENLVCDEKGYIRITDFGVAKIRKEDNSSETSGTPGYMAPEVLMAQNHSFPVDFFAIGIMGYEFMFGNRPYKGRSRKEIKSVVLRKQARIKEDELPNDWSKESMEFFNRCLKRKENKRIGFLGGCKELMNHNWFNNFDWDALFKKEMNSPFIPKSGGNYDKKYCEGIEKFSPQTIERYQAYMQKENFLTVFEGYTFFDEGCYEDVDFNESGRFNSKGSKQMNTKSTTIGSINNNNSNDVKNGNKILRQSQSQNNLMRESKILNRFKINNNNNNNNFIRFSNNNLNINNNSNNNNNINNNNGIDNITSLSNNRRLNIVSREKRIRSSSLEHPNNNNHNIINNGSQNINNNSNNNFIRFGNTSSKFNSPMFNSLKRFENQNKIFSFQLPMLNKNISNNNILPMLKFNNNNHKINFNNIRNKFNSQKKINLFAKNKIIVNQKNSIGINNMYKNLKRAESTGFLKNNNSIRKKYFNEDKNNNIYNNNVLFNEKSYSLINLSNLSNNNNNKSNSNLYNNFKYNKIEDV